MGARALWPGAALLAAAIALCLLAGCARSAAPAARPAPATVALIERAEAAERERRYERADALYREARARAPDDLSRARAALAHGRALLFWGRYADAEAALSEAAAARPGDPGAWHDLGMVRHQRGDLAGAELAFRRSIAARPDDGRSRVALAALLWKQKRLPEALREYRALAALEELPPRLRERVAWAIQTLARLTGES
ncbi:TPR repeat-containing protein [Haliangium ochraceum DSM 14365]|uniref:TPR repeat-containing protein n=2 Tax=Haliangium ochraceum TaxID=80816 RepID=D0LXD6_HALO1|nr:TPR repeat-containing protein [Haliangium ochraceum DSM 14365]